MPDFADRTHPAEGGHSEGQAVLIEQTYPPRLSLEDLREEYRKGALDEANCERNPFWQFQHWLREAQTADLKEPTAMTLATSTLDGKPSARIVLLKEITEDGFVFYTNYESRKGQEIKANPNVALTFYWSELERQVRIEGRTHRVSREKSEAYFRKRPKGSRLGAIVSNQSTVVEGRAPLEAKLRILEERYKDTDDIPTPECWGGYCVVPDRFEFWQGRPNRLHDRLIYRRNGENTWILERLSP
jgi:pyridoxamine 5'-phosphate oxidase